MKKKLLVLPIIAGLMGVGIAFGSNNVRVVKAEGEESVVETIEESQEEIESFVSEETSEQKEGVVKTFIDTYVVPIVATLGVGFFVSVIYGVTMAIVNGLRNKKMVASNQEAAEMVAGFIKVCGELLEHSNENEKQFLEMKKVFEEKLIEVENYVLKETKDIKQSASEIEKNSEKALEMKSALLILIELESELAKVNQTAVSNGVVKKIAELQSQARKLL